MPAQTKIDFKQLRDTIQIGSVLAKYGIQFRQVSGELVANCPLPFHPQGHSPNSFKVGIAKNKWYCHNSGCRAASNRPKGGDVIDLVAELEKCGSLAAAIKLVGWFHGNGNGNGNGHKPEPKPEPATHPVPEKNEPLKFELKGISYHPYLQERGISEELASKFGVGYFPGKGSMAGRVVIPIRNEAGELVAYAGRSIDNSEPKYKLPIGFQKGLVLYNRHAIKGDTVTVVEGYFGAMKVTEAGFPCVALMGSTLTDGQENLLNFKFITLMLDPDETGKNAACELVPRLAQNHYVRIARNDKSPDEMTPDEIKNALRYVCPLPAPK